MLERVGLPLVAGLLAGLAASLCCAGPLVLLLLGFGGAWIGGLTALEPYRPLLIGAAMASLFIAYRRIYRPMQQFSCADEMLCSKPQTSRFNKWLFAVMAVAVSISIISPYLIPVVYG